MFQPSPASWLARELPVDGDTVSVHFPVPCPCFPLELSERRDSPLAQALTGEQADLDLRLVQPDRKSTRLNSSHLGISYAVFCLKKKKKQKYTTYTTALTCRVHSCLVSMAPL